MERSLCRPVLFAAALLLPLGLAACGVKGPLEAPPRAAAVAEAPGAPPPARAGLPEPALNVTGIPTGPRVEAVTPAAVDEAPKARRRSALDWLID